MVNFVEPLVIVVGRTISDDLRLARKDPKNHRLHKHALYVKSAKDVSELLSPQKIGLLMEIAKYDVSKGVCQMAKETGRNQTAISRDLKKLESIGAVKRNKKGRNVFIEPQIDSIEIKFK